MQRACLADLPCAVLEHIAAAVTVADRARLGACCRPLLAAVRAAEAADPRLALAACRGTPEVFEDLFWRLTRAPHRLRAAAVIAEHARRLGVTLHVCAPDNASPTVKLTAVCAPVSPPELPRCVALRCVALRCVALRCVASFSPTTLLPSHHPRRTPSSPRGART